MTTKPPTLIDRLIAAVVWTIMGCIAVWIIVWVLVSAGVLG